MSARQPRAPIDVPGDAWQEACRRESVVRPMVAERRLSRQAMTEACGQLGLGKSQVPSRLKSYGFAAMERKFRSKAERDTMAHSIELRSISRPNSPA